jgi:hypothetical protein
MKSGYSVGVIGVRNKSMRFNVESMVQSTGSKISIACNFCGSIGRHCATTFHV